MTTTRTIMSATETTAWFLDAIDWTPTYFLGSVPVHVVDETHWLARHHDEMPAHVVVYVGDEDDPWWRSIEQFDRREGRPPRLLVVIRR